MSIGRFIEVFILQVFTFFFTLENGNTKVEDCVFLSLYYLYNEDLEKLTKITFNPREDVFHVFSYKQIIILKKFIF